MALPAGKQVLKNVLQQQGSDHWSIADIGLTVTKLTEL
jgi:hypothetical protein